MLRLLSESLNRWADAPSIELLIRCRERGDLGAEGWPFTGCFSQSGDTNVPISRKMNYLKYFYIQRFTQCL